MLNFYDFVNSRRQSGATTPVTEKQEPMQIDIPDIDGTNPIGSLAGILGPTPEERAAEEERLQQHRQKMHGWTALFNGLRHLSNLYFTTKGAQPQKYGDPHSLIEQQYKDERKRLDDMHTANQRYYTSLWNLYRQGQDEQRRSMLAEAQAKYYDTRDEVARMKAENDRLKNEKYIQLQDGRIAKLDAETNRIKEILPLQEQEIKSRINKNNRIGTGGNKGTYGHITTKHVDPATGDVITERVPTTGGKPMTTVTPGKKAPSGKKAPAPKKTDKKKKHVGW